MEHNSKLDGSTSVNLNVEIITKRTVDVQKLNQNKGFLNQVTHSGKTRNITCKQCGSTLTSICKPDMNVEEFSKSIVDVSQTHSGEKTYSII